MTVCVLTTNIEFVKSRESSRRDCSMYVEPVMTNVKNMILSFARYTMDNTGVLRTTKQSAMSTHCNNAQN